MAFQRIQLEGEPSAALARVRSASREGSVLVFKKSPICPVSHKAEGELRSWLETYEGEVTVAFVDVIAERPLARGLTAELDVQHESPQALWFDGGELTWHGSHGELTRERFDLLAAGTL